MRILMLHNDYLSVGGEYFSVRSESAGLAAIGNDVRLELKSNEYLDSASPVGKLRGVLDQPDAYAQVSEAIAAHKPDIVHAQNLFPSLGAGAIRAIRDSRVPWVRTLRNFRKICIAGNCVLRGDDCSKCKTAATGVPGIVHGCYRESAAASVGAVAYARIESFAETRYPPSAYILLSESMRAPLSHITSGVDVFVKPNPVQAPPSVATSFEDREWDVIYVGRLTSEKNPGLALKLANARPNFRILVVGDGPLREELESQSKSLPNVTLAGHLDSRDVMRSVARAKLLIAPSAWNEPFGRVAAESLSVGTPPIVADRGGLPDIVGDMDTMHVVQNDDIASWLRAIDWIHGLTRGEYDRLSTRCIQVWSEHFEERVNAGALERIYSQVLQRS